MISLCLVFCYAQVFRKRERDVKKLPKLQIAIDEIHQWHHGIQSFRVVFCKKLRNSFPPFVHPPLRCSARILEMRGPPAAAGTVHLGFSRAAHADHLPAWRTLARQGARRARPQPGRGGRRESGYSVRGSWRLPWATDAGAAGAEMAGSRMLKRILFALVVGLTMGYICGAARSLIFGKPAAALPAAHPAVVAPAKVTSRAARAAKRKHAVKLARAVGKARHAGAKKRQRAMGFDQAHPFRGDVNFNQAQALYQRGERARRLRAAGLCAGWQGALFGGVGGLPGRPVLCRVGSERPAREQASSSSTWRRSRGPSRTSKRPS